MARYELRDDKAGKFFEITLAGNRVATIAGIVGAYSTRSDGHTFYGSDAGRRGGRTYKDATAARAAFDKAVAAKKAEGYERVDRPEELSEATSKVEREPALEAAIAASSGNDDAPFLVYADWLQERGDPRGEFIALQTAKQQQSDPSAFMQFKQREQALRFAYERAWIGEVTFACGHRLKLDWKHGFIENARIGATTNPTEPPMAAVLESLLRSPAGCAIRSLELVGSPHERSAELLAALALLPSPGLRRVRGDSRCADLAAARTSYEAHRIRIEAAQAVVHVHLFE